MGTAPASHFFCAGAGFFGSAGVEKRSSSETSSSNNPLGFDWLFVSNFGGGPPLLPRNGSLNKSSSSSSERNGFIVRDFEVVVVVVIGSGDLREKGSLVEGGVVCIKEWMREEIS